MPGFGLGLGLGKNHTATRHHRVTGKDGGAFRRAKRGGGFGLFQRHAPRVIGRKLTAARCFVDVSRQHQIRRDADLGKQTQSPRRGGSKDKLVVCGGHLAPFIRRGTARAALGARPT